MNQLPKNPSNDDDAAKFIPKDLTYDPNKGSYELDVNDNDPEWDHPADYETIAEGAKDDDSTYDNSNPLVGDEYADKKNLIEDDFDDLGIQIIRSKDLKVSKMDEELSKTEEDFRDDLDDEGYPKNI